MKIFGIGLSRTGTRSLARGLECLGFNTGHFDKAIRAVQLENGRIVPNFEQINRWDALTDIPMAAIYRSLAESLPDARFILTVRDRGAWLASCECHLGRDNSAYLERHGIDPDLVMALRRAVYRRTSFDRDDFNEACERHTREVLDFFQTRPGQLLVLNPCEGEGWEKLCSFLDVSIPPIAFPHENNSFPAKAG